MKRILIYLGITFSLSYAYIFGVAYPLTNNASASGLSDFLTVFAIGAVMLFPALGVLLTRLITKEGFKNSLIKPVHFKKTFKYYLIAWFGPVILSIIGTAVYFLIFNNDFDPTMATWLTSMNEQLAAQGAPTMTTESLQGVFLVQILISVLSAPLLNFITCFGEEWGWRGYLLPKVHERLSFVPTMLITGVIWGLWHAPLTAIGHNYGLDYPGFPFAGIAAMCCFCIVVGTFLSYLTIKAKSCLPAVIGHGALNGFASVPLFFSLTGGSPFVGPASTGIIGGFAFIVAAIIIMIALRKEPGTWSAQD